MLRRVNPVALITGASRGIGRGIALELAKGGFELCLNYLSHTDAANQTVSECHAQLPPGHRPHHIELFRADISLSQDRHKLIEFTRERFGRLDLLVNNAGVAPANRADLLECTEESFERLFNINVKGPFFLTQLAARWMLEQQQAGMVPAGQSRKIITISSLSAYTASTNRGDYCVSKAALSMLTPLYAARLADHGIQVFELRPGIISTDMTNPVKEKYDALISGGLTPLKRWGLPADVAKAVAAIAADYLPFSTGEVVNVDGGFHLRRL